MRRVLALLLPLLLAVPPTAWGSAIYVSPSGTDNATCGSGDGAAACKTLDYTFRSRLGGNSTHTVYLESTTYGNGTNALFTGGNTNLVTVFGGSRVRVEPTTPGSPYTICIPTNTGAANLLTMGANDRLTMFGGKLTNPGSLNKGMAKCAVGSAYLEFNNFELDHNGTATAAMFVLGNADTANNFEISLTNGTVAHNAANGLSAAANGGARFTATDSFFYNFSNIAVGLAVNNVSMTMHRNTFANCLYPFNWAYAGGTLDFQNNTVTTPSGTARSGFRLASGAGAYFVANPALLQVLGNNFYTFGTGATFDNALWDVGDVLITPDLSNGSWNPGFTEAQGGNGTYPASRVVIPRSNVTKTHAAGFFGDSIAAGSSSSNNATKSAWARFAAFTGQSAMTHLVAAWPGARIEGAWWRLDRTYGGSERPRTAFLLVGINNLDSSGALYPSALTNSTLAAAIYRLGQQAEAWGAEPMWLGIGSDKGSDANVIATNKAVELLFRASGHPYGSWLDEMKRRSTWSTYYYSNLAGDVHPNDLGHALIAELAVRLSQGTSLGGVRPYTVIPATIRPAILGN